MKIFLILQIISLILSATMPDVVRKKERQITDPKDIEQFLSEQRVIRIGYYDKAKEEVYIVPLDYGFKVENGEYIFYLHGGPRGRKYDLTKEEPNVGFEIDGNYELVRDEVACKHSAKYKSIIGNGKIQLIDDINEKKNGLDIIMEHATGENGFEYNQKMLEHVAIYKLTATKLTCKANL